MRTVPDEPFERTFLLEDMTALLIACAKEPLRLRATDHELPAKTVRELADKLRPLPKWVDEGFDLDRETRLRTTVAYLETFRLVEDAPPATHLRISALGRQWLDLSVGERHRVLLDGILDRKQAVAPFREFPGAGIGAVSPQVRVRSSIEPLPDFDSAVREPFREVQGDCFFPIERVLAYCRNANPLLAIFREDTSAAFEAGSWYTDRLDAENLQKLWADAVRFFLRTRLLPLGAVRVGKSQGKQGLSIAITAPGRYYLGQTAAWLAAEIADSQVILQPNFEVTFLGEAAGAEAEIGRFAERRGQQMGALFQITKKSIHAAASAGLTAEFVLATLERLCARAVPGNVRHEIEDWFAQGRKVSIESVRIIRCPDRETASRILDLAKGCATALNDTVLEYSGTGNQHRGLIRKLQGIGVQVAEQVTVTPERRPQRQWGRW